MLTAQIHISYWRKIFMNNLRKKTPAVYIDFVGTIVGTYDYNRHLREAISVTGVDPETCKDPEKLAEIDREYTKRVLADPASKVQTDKTLEVLNWLEQKGFKIVVWSIEDAYTVGEILKREDLQVDRIDALTGYGRPTSDGLDFIYEPFAKQVNKAELLQMTEYTPTIVVDDDIKNLESCKLSGRTDIKIFLAILINPDDYGIKKLYQDKLRELEMNLILSFSRTIEGLFDILGQKK